MKRPKDKTPKDKTGERDTRDKLIGNAEGMGAKLMLAAYGLKAKEFLEDPVSYLAWSLNLWRELKHDGWAFEELTKLPQLKRRWAEDLIRWHSLFRVALRDGPEVLEKLVKEWRRAQKLKLSTAPDDAIRWRILNDHYSGTLNINRLSRELRIPVRTLREIKARLGLNKSQKASLDPG
jgi:hypothetical protein